MAKFTTTWSTGKKETVEQADCATVEQFVNTRFGAGIDLAAHGVVVELVVETQPETQPVVPKAEDKPEAPKAGDKPVAPKTTKPKAEAKA